jgi:alkylation response protein AidB-like acyl-CoA dehydrogenase
MKIEQCRLLVLKTAWLMDTIGNRGARIEVSAIKVAAPEVATWVIDRAIQAHGGMGVSQGTLLPGCTRSPASCRSPTGLTRSTTWRSRGARRAATASSRWLSDLTEIASVSSVYLPTNGLIAASFSDTFVLR